jgi:Alkylmercury lyase
VSSIPLAALHHAILVSFFDDGYPPTPAELAVRFGASEAQIEDALAALADEHGVVLHPNSARVWVIHPLSAAPTSFLVRSGTRELWGNCAWCSLGAAALLAQRGDDATITTTLGANGKQVSLHVRGGRLEEEGYLVHFPVPMRQAWDNVLYTCSVMLLFDGEAAIDDWCARHRIARGAAHDARQVFELAAVWYGQHLSPAWRKWTASEAREIFERFGFTGPTWDLPAAKSRF